jgi:hypothetical protein
VKVCALQCALENRDCPRLLPAAAPTHKIKWSHCYFFPAVVIGR